MVRRDNIAALVAVPGLAAVLLGTVAIVGYESFAENASDGPSAIVWQSADIGRSVIVFWLAGGAAIATSAIVSRARPGGKAFRWREGGDLVISGSAALGLLIGASLLTLAGVLVYGAENLLSRSTYIPQPAIPALAAYAGFLLPSGFAISVLVAETTRGAARFLASVLIAVQVLATFAMASRQLALLPLMALAIGYSVRGRASVTRVVSAALASFLALALVVSLREAAAGSHGLGPYVTAVVTGSVVDWSSSGSLVLGNLVFAVPLTGYVADLHEFAWSDLWLSMNPLPSSAAAWAARSPELRVHYFIPFNAVGELSSLSIWLLLVAVVAATLSTYALVNVVAARGSRMVPNLLLMLYYMSFALSLQYNTRSVARFVLAIVALAGLAYASSLVSRSLDLGHGQQASRRLAHASARNVRTARHRRNRTSS